MNDAKQQLRALDAIAPPDVWEDASVRQPIPGEADPIGGSSLSRRVMAGTLAFAVFAVAGTFAWRALRFEERPIAREASPGGPWSEYGQGWTRLPDPDENLPGSAWTWTGSELLMWGGAPESDTSQPSASGQRFDPTTGAWRPMPDAQEGRSYALTAWTGDEVLFWGGWNENGPRADGLAFDPITDAWRSIPPSPHGSGEVAVSLWTGNELIVWGGGDPGSARSRQGAAYDPDQDAWRELSLAPLGLNLADAVWTGREMIVFGSLLNGRNIAETDTAVGATYDPRADRWEELPPSELDPQATAAGLVGGKMVAYDYKVRSQTYDLDRGRWNDPTTMPMEFSECYPSLAVVEDVLFAFFCGQAATYESGRGWSPIRGGMLDKTLEVGGTEYPLYRFATIVPVDGGIVFAAEGITKSKQGEACYGCPGSPRALWLWRPDSLP
jgi:hypothetical protein